MSGPPQLRRISGSPSSDTSESQVVLTVLMWDEIVCHFLRSAHEHDANPYYAQPPAVTQQ